MRTSIRDVAREAGVSYVTVANVLNGRQKRASAETYERVLQVARAMNYMPVTQPSTQRRQVETRIIGLVFDQIDLDGFWGLRASEGLRQGASEHGYDLLTILRQTPDRAADQQERRFLDRRSDGLIFLMPEGRDELFRVLVEHEVPTVVCYLDDVPPGIATVVVDNHGAMRMAVRHLVETGHRRILFLSAAAPRADFKHCQEGYHAAMVEAGLEPLELLLDMCRGWQEPAMRDIAAIAPTAIVCSADVLALQIRAQLLASGVRVPEDISLIGMDDLPEAEVAGLTTIRISDIEVGRQAVEVMIQRIAGEDAERCHRTIPLQLIERRTVAPPAR